MTDHAKAAADKVFPTPLMGNPNGDWRHMTIRKSDRDAAVVTIQAAIEAGTVDLRTAYNEALNALAASHKRRDELEAKVKELEAKLKDRS